MQLLPVKHNRVYNALQVLLLLVYATRNTGATTLYINSLAPFFSKSVFKTLVGDFTNYKKSVELLREYIQK